jgi:hypothetical protein
MMINQLQNLNLFSQSTGLISDTTVILYRWTCNSLDAVHALPIETHNFVVLIILKLYLQMDMLCWEI